MGMAMMKQHEHDPSAVSIWEFLETESNRVMTSHSMGMNGIIKQAMFRTVNFLMTNLGTHPCTNCEFLSAVQPYWGAEMTGWVTKNGRMAQAISQKRLNMVVSKTAVFKNQTVVFPETVFNHWTFSEPKTTEIEIDTVIAATGFRNDFGWIKADFEWNPRTWYKHMFIPKYDGKLIFIGWARPHQGGIPGTGELQSRYAAMVLSGERKLPENYAELAIEEGREEQEFFQTTPHLTSLTDYASFTSAMAELIGCRPKITDVGLRFERLMQYLWFPQWHCWFRLVGPKAKPEITEEVLSTVRWFPDPQMGPITTVMAFFQRAMNVVGSVFAPLIPQSGGLHWIYKEWFISRGVRMAGNDWTALRNTLAL